MLILQWAFFILLVASFSATIVIAKVVKAINKHGNDIGVYAYMGMTFIGMTWAATLLMLATGFMFLYEWRRQKRGAAFFGKGEVDYE